MHLSWRWFTGLGFDQEIPLHSTFSKNRHRWFQESKLFEQLFEQIVSRCVEVGHHTVRQYLRELEEQNPVEEPVHEQDQVRECWAGTLLEAFPT